MIVKMEEIFMIDLLSKIKNWWFRPKESGGSGPQGSKRVNIMDKLAEDIGRLSKNQFRLGQQFEDFAEEVLEAVRQEIKLAEVYKKWAESKDAAMIGFHHRLTENEKRIENLVFALINLADALEMIYRFVIASGDTDWRLQMERVQNTTRLLLAENGIQELGHENFFDDSLHEAIATVQEEGKDLREITDIEQKGYSYWNKVLRKAKVVVNTLPKEQPENERNE
jgi:molecular chaperone GrpE (heat shock protein)